MLLISLNLLTVFLVDQVRTTVILLARFFFAKAGWSSTLSLLGRGSLKLRPYLVFNFLHLLIKSIQLSVLMMVFYNGLQLTLMRMQPSMTAMGYYTPGLTQPPLRIAYL